MRIRILVIDDEESLCDILKFNLEKEGYEVDCAYSAEEALEMNLSVYQLFIVDIMMGRLSGFDFAKRVKNDPATENIPIMFCSALNGEDDMVMGLNIGTDDYITKPFVIGVVLARVRAVLRRSQATQPIGLNQPRAGAYEPDITFKNLRIDRNGKTCYLNGEPMSLTRTEFDILLFFLSHRNRIYSREEIIKQVWPGDVVVTNRTIDTNIARLRRKLGEYGSNIVTRLGFGYGFKETTA
ncbi:MAG: response regulator transcription factor [Muribaculaceae bacterium]|nr:response regulator transcription factor [Muribaculaceae bacterium]